MANKEIIIKLLKQLREYIAKLKVLQKYSFEGFQKNIEVNWAIDRGLQLAIESSCDIGREIISGGSFEKPETYKQIFQILSKRAVIPFALAKELQRLAHFRNKLIHDYLFTEPEEIYAVLQNDLKYFEQFLVAVGGYISKKSKNKKTKLI